MTSTLKGIVTSLCPCALGAEPPFPYYSVRQFLSRTGFKTFSEKTMLRILSECAASVRKSLQGLDYFAADGSKAFEDLAEVVKGIPAVVLEQDWKHEVQESLKAAKLYLKGDYKVIYSLKTFCSIEDVFVSACALVRRVVKTQRSTYTLEQTNSPGSAFISKLKCEIQNLIIEHLCQSRFLTNQRLCTVRLLSVFAFMTL